MAKEKGCENMKTLISLKEVEAALEHGDTILYIDADTIITPAARFAALAAGLFFDDDISNA